MTNRTDKINNGIGRVPRKARGASAPRRNSRSASGLPAQAGRPGHEEIAKRAYYLYLARGGEPGSDFEDWLRAERELQDEQAPRVKRGRAADQRRAG